MGPSVCLSVYLSMYLSFVSVFLSVCLMSHMDMCVCVCVCLFVCLCVCECMCVCVFVCIWNSSLHLSYNLWTEKNKSLNLGFVNYFCELFLVCRLYLATLAFTLAYALNTAGVIWIHNHILLYFKTNKCRICIAF